MIESLDAVQKFEDLPTLIDANGGVLSIPMARLRDAYGAGRLGKHVRSNISNQLRSLGLAHMPAELPDSQLEQVRLYRAGSPAGRLIEAVTNLGAKGDAVIREAASAQSTQILEKIRELVCE